jgi:peptide/nickel transport system ATP-binding protein
MQDSENILELHNIVKIFRRGIIWGPKIVAVNNVSFKMSKEPEILTIAGESGCGKTTLAKIILHIMEPTSGRILLNGQDMTKVKGKNRYKLIRLIQPVFQNPYETFNPLKKIDTYLYDTAKLVKEKYGEKSLEKIIDEGLNSVGLSWQEVKDKYPHEFSGGQLQRISLARSLILNPLLLVADEPISMLDVSLRVSILNLFKELKNNKRVSIIYITHDLSTAYYVSDKIAIMFRGSFVELGNVEDVLNYPLHPYTSLLRKSILKPVVNKKDEINEEINIKSTVDEFTEFIEKGCKFSLRCPNVMEICKKQDPPVFFINNREVKCWLYGK